MSQAENALAFYIFKNEKGTIIHYGEFADVQKAVERVCALDFNGTISIIRLDDKKLYEVGTVERQFYGYIGYELIGREHIYKFDITIHNGPQELARFVPYRHKEQLRLTGMEPDEKIIYVCLSFARGKPDLWYWDRKYAWYDPYESYTIGFEDLDEFSDNIFFSIDDDCDLGNSGLVVKETYTFADLKPLYDWIIASDIFDIVDNSEVSPDAKH